MVTNQYRDVIQGAQQFLLNMPDPIYIIGLDDRILWVNRAFEQLFGYTAEYLYGNGLQFYPEYTSIEIEQYKNQLKHSETVSVYTSRHCKDGTRLYVNINLMPIRDRENTVVAYTVVMKETISEESLTNQSEQRYRIIAENTSDTIVLVDNDAVVRYVSPSILQLAGYTAEEYEGQDAFEPIHPDDRERARQSQRTAVQTGRPVTLEYRIVHKLGHTVYVEARVMPVSDRNGNMEYVVAVARDVTERKKTDQLLQNILDNVNAAVWSSDREFKRLTWCSESIEKMFGLPKSVVEENPVRMHDNIHPEDAAALHEEVGNGLRRGIPAVKAVRLTDAQGETKKWIKIIAQPIQDPMGTIERIDGIFLDITEQKRSELALEESEQRYKSLFENNLDGVFSINLDGRFVNANKSFEAIAGIPLARLFERSFMSLVSDEDCDKVGHVLTQVIEHRRPRDIEFCMNRRNHGDKIVNVTLVPIFLSGRLNGVHGIVKDITERKREERELIQSEEKSKFLQQRLNRLSSDLANVMKVTELEERLAGEVKEVLRAADVSVEEIPRGKEPVSADSRYRWVKISEKKHPVYLRFQTEHSLLKMEEEWLETAIRYATILYDNLHRIEDLMHRLETMVAGNETPKWMLRLLFKLSEKERFSLSSDLHDSVLQDLIIWYRKLESLRSQNRFADPVQAELARIEEGLLDAIHQIRITCNELRPPFLLNMGLVESVKSLLSYTRMFANYEIEFSAEPFEGLLGEEQVIGLYRIVQELLNNASKHSAASKVEMALAAKPGFIEFTYADDGIGMDLSSFEGSFQHMGISGIEKRVLSLDGEMDMRSSPNQGFHVNIRIPKHT